MKFPPRSEIIGDSSLTIEDLEVGCECTKHIKYRKAFKSFLIG